MEKVLILYYSGVGNTKRVAEMMFYYLDSVAEVEIYSIEELHDNFNFNNYNSLIIGFPTIHSKPAKPIMKFLNNLDILKTEISAFIFTTCGLYSANTLRIFAKGCLLKNIIPVINRSYRCEAVDGILLAPAMKRWYTCEKNLSDKVNSDIKWFMDNGRKKTPIIPKIKWYSILNYVNGYIGENYRFKIYLHKERCIKCKKCAIKCPVKAISLDKDNYPIVDKLICINCYRCIHHCPKLALSLSKKKPTKRTIFSKI